MFDFERRWAEATLAGFAPPGDRGLVPGEATIDWMGAWDLINRSGNARGRLGTRVALWVVALSPLYLLVAPRTLAGLQPAARARLLDRLLTSAFWPLRELTLLLKMVASFAFLAHPDVRRRSNYERHPEGVGVVAPEAYAKAPERRPLLLAAGAPPTAQGPRGAGPGPTRAQRTTLLEDEADFVIVGTGAGGATAARVLAGAGCDVLMLEEGRLLRDEDRPRELMPSMAASFRDFGMATTTGGMPIPLLQGRCVGGSTAINCGIIWRLPEDVRRNWIDEWGLQALVDEQGLNRAYEQIEADLEITETSFELLGNQGLLMHEACKKLGLPGKAMSRNARRCRASGQCLQGCPGKARQSMDVSYVPSAQADGARLHTELRVTRVLIEGGKAVGVVGDLLDPTTRAVTGTARVRARKAVILAASAIYTPVILHRSGLRGAVGERFQAHPGSAVIGRFPFPVAMNRGATQGYEVPMRDRGWKIETLSLPPEMLATRLPGAGPRWQERLVDLDQYAQWCAQVRMEAKGTVRPARSGKSGAPAEVRFAPTQRDLDKKRDVLALICKMMFAAGATEVYPGVGRVPEVLTSVEQVRWLEQLDVRHHDLHLMASHLFGTAVAGKDPARSVVGPDLQSHEVRGLYVMDASVFPTNLGVNPQHSIMALVFHAAARLANR